MGNYIEFKYLNKDGLITGISNQKTRAKFLETVSIEPKPELSNKEFTYLLHIQHRKGNISLHFNSIKSSFEEEAKNKIIDLLKISGMGIGADMWKVSKEIIFVRLVYNIVLPNKTQAAGYTFLLITYSEKLKAKIKIEFSLEFVEIWMGKIGFPRKLGIPLPSGESINPEKHTFLINYRDKLSLNLFNTKEKPATKVMWQLEDNNAKLAYYFDVKSLGLEDLNSLNCRKIVYPYLHVNLESYLFSPKFTSFEFHINEKDWISLIAIMSIQFTDRKSPFNLPIRNRMMNFSKVKLFKEVLSNKIKIYKADDVITTINTTNSEKEVEFDEIIKELTHSTNCQQTYRTMFVFTKNKPNTALMAIPLMRYLQGKPCFYTKNKHKFESQISKMIKRIYFIDLIPHNDIKKLLQQKSIRYQIISARNDHKTIRLINDEFAKIIAIDSLLASYWRIPTNKLGTLVSQDKDKYPQRLDIVKKLPKRFQSLLRPVALQKIDEKEFNDLRFKLYSFPIQDFIPMLFKFANDVFISLTLAYSDKEAFFKNSGKRDFYHFTMIDPESELHEIMCASIYAGYRGYFLLSIDRRQIEQNHNAFNKRILQIDSLLLENKITLIKDRLKRYSNTVSIIIRPYIQDFILELCTKDNDAIEQQKIIGQGLGYITFFVPPDETFYEAITLQNKIRISKNFSIGRMPLIDSEISSTMVSNTFNQFIGYKKDFSLYSLHDLVYKGSTDFAVAYTKELFQIFSKLGIKSKIFINTSADEKDLSNIISDLDTYSMFLFWGHGSPDLLFLQSIKKHTESNEEVYLHKELNDEFLSELNFISASVAFLNACLAGRTYKRRDYMNLSTFLISKGYMGVASSFWQIDTESAVFVLMNTLFKMILGFSIPSVLRSLKNKEFGLLSEFYIYYGDPTFVIDEFYESEIQLVEKNAKKLKKQILEFRNMKFKVIETK